MKLLSFIQVVLCSHLNVRCLCRHLLCDLCLCGRHHTRAWEEHCLWFGKEAHFKSFSKVSVKNLSIISSLFPSFLQVSATFAASLVTSPAIGAYLSEAYSDTLVVILATVIALLDICFILMAVPESLPEKMRPASWGAPISWEQADPFAVSNTVIFTDKFQCTGWANTTAVWFIIC